jgi:hypothetical protein
VQYSWKGEPPGFDVDAAAASLTAWLLGPGAAANEVDGPLGRTMSAVAKATDHIVMHDYQAETPCLALPCPVLGVSWALTLCAMHQRERSVFSPWLGFAEQAEHSASEIRKEHRRLQRRVAVLQEASKERHRLETETHAPPDAHAHDVLCENPIAAVTHCLEIADQLEATAAAIRRESNMPEFRQRPPPSRRPLALLTAVWQHLRFDGGFTYAAIAELVPDEQSPAGLPRRIRAAMRRPDVRWQSANARPNRTRKKAAK